MGWDNNVYYNPEKWGLSPIGEVEYSSGYYEFDIVAVWKDKEGTLYWAQDSGCSCPTPFDRFDSLDELTTGDWADLEAELIAQDEASYHKPGSRRGEISSLIQRARSV